MAGSAAVSALPVWRERDQHVDVVGSFGLVGPQGGWFGIGTGVVCVGSERGLAFLSSIGGANGGELLVLMVSRCAGLTGTVWVGVEVG